MHYCVIIYRYMYIIIFTNICKYILIFTNIFYILLIHTSMYLYILLIYTTNI